jgi:hypothetical protein
VRAFSTTFGNVCFFLFFANVGSDSRTRQIRMIDVRMRMRTSKLA